MISERKLDMMTLDLEYRIQRRLDLFERAWMEGREEDNGDLYEADTGRDDFGEAQSDLYEEELYDNRQAR